MYLYHNPEYRSQALSYWIQREQFHGKQINQYTSRAPDGEGKVYSSSRGGQMLPKQIQLLFFGRNHVEAGIMGAVYEIVRRRMHMGFLKCLWLPPIMERRHAFSFAVGTVVTNLTSFIKHPLSRALNSCFSESDKWQKSHKLQSTLSPFRSIFLLQFEPAQAISTCTAQPCERSQAPRS